TMYGNRNKQRGNRNYLCETHSRRSPDFCTCSWVREGEIIEVILNSVERHFLRSGKVEDRRTRKRAINRPTAKTVAIGRLRLEPTTIDHRLALAAHRLLEIDSDVLDVAQHQYRSLQSQRCAILAALSSQDADATSTPTLTVERAVNWLTRVRSVLGIAT